jgi:hypothetical protein
VASSCERCGKAFQARRPWQRFCGAVCRRAEFKSRKPLSGTEYQNVAEHLAALPDRDFREVLRRTLWARELEAARREKRAPRSGRLRVRWHAASNADLYDTDRGPLWSAADDEIAAAESVTEGGNR